jgi:hypothetical protein
VYSRRLSKRRASFEAAKLVILSAAQLEEDHVKRLALLSDGVKRCFEIKVDNLNKVMKGHTKHSALEIEVKNLDRFLAQANKDPSVSHELLKQWDLALRRHVDM